MKFTNSIFKLATEFKDKLEPDFDNTNKSSSEYALLAAIHKAMYGDNKGVDEDFAKPEVLSNLKNILYFGRVLEEKNYFEYVGEIEESSTIKLGEDYYLNVALGEGKVAIDLPESAKIIYLKKLTNIKDLGNGQIYYSVIYGSTDQ